MFLRPAIEWPAMRERARRIMSAVRNRQGASLTVIQCADESYSAVKTSVLEEMEANGLPDAFIGTNESIAYAALGVLETAGFSVPEDIVVA